MSAKSRIFGLLAAVALSFSMVGGAMANDTEPVSVTLSDSSMLCSIDIYAVGGTFGTWEWDNSLMQYVEVGGAGTTIGFWGDLYVPTFNGCDVTISFAGLSDGVNTIDTTNFSAYSYYQGGPVDPALFGDTGVGAGAGTFAIYDFDYTLDTVPNVPPGTYTGNIDATISNAV